MKQLDIILSAVAIVIGVVAVIIIIGTKRAPVPAPQVPRINTAEVQLPDAPVAYSNGLPGGGGGGARMGRGKGRAGFVGG
ncbi:MAG: hypothetical protein QOJ65_312 [Fimbriimonadaceae bacterium]|jgi:hypothetical protein|nr:hypothetical protein [Fimbriimonadaceae bacterium]